MAIKTIVEPLPESALQGLIKIEGDATAVGATSIPHTVQLQLHPVAMSGPTTATTTIDLIPDVYSVAGVTEAVGGVVTPVSPTPSLTNGKPTPPLPAGGGKIKSGKKSGNSSSSSSTTTTIIKAAAPSIQVSEDDDLSNVTSFETRVNIIAQRVSLSTSQPVLEA